MRNRENRAFKYVVSLVFVALAVPSALQGQSYGFNPSADVRGDQWDPIRAIIKHALDSNVTASVSVAVAHRGRIVWEEGFGYADRARQVPASPRTSYALASLTKPFTATALMQLVEQGKVRLDRPVNDYLGAAKVTGLGGSADSATIGRVLSHTAGLPAYYHFFYEGRKPEVPSPDTTIARYGIIVTPPGTTYEYSNLGYGIIGHVIERVSGKSYAEHMHDAVFTRLGLTDTFVGLGRESAAILYDADMTPVPSYSVSHSGASAIWSSAHDVVRFGMFHLKNRLQDQEPILSDATLDVMKRSHTPGTLQERYGLGWIVVPDDNGYPVVAHAGGMPGVATVLVLFPTEDLAITVLTNGEGFIPGQLVDPIAGTVLPKYALTQQARDEDEPPVESAPPPGPRVDLIGEWKGTVRTYSGSVPLVLDVKSDGDVHVTLGDELPTLLKIKTEEDPGESLRVGGWNLTIEDTTKHLVIEVCRTSEWLVDCRRT